MHAAVHDPARVRGVQRLGERGDLRGGVGRLVRTVLAQHRREVAPLDPLAHDVRDVDDARGTPAALGRALLDRGVVDPCQQRRDDRAGARGGLQERARGGGTATAGGAQHLDRDRAGQHLVDRAPQVVDGVVLAAVRDALLQAVPPGEQVAGLQDGTQRAAAGRRSHGSSCRCWPAGARS